MDMGMGMDTAMDMAMVAQMDTMRKNKKRKNQAGKNYL